MYVFSEPIYGNGEFIGELDYSETRISLSGSGDIRVSVLEELDAKVIGSGQIAYLGSPVVVSANTSGSGKIYRGS